MIIVCLFIASCGIKESNTHNKENQSLNIVDITTEEILEFKKKEVITNNNNTLQDDFINYQQYIKKIWIVDEGNGYSYLYPFSFYIIKIENGKIDGKFLFRPYNLADIDNLLIDEELSFSTKLNSWNDIQFVTGISTGNKPHPVAYLTNEKNDIIYQFSAPFPTASKIISVVIEDFNEDELKDIKIITDFSDSPSKVLIEWIFYQMENGLFYNLD